jgi:hypothetical protein
MSLFSANPQTALDKVNRKIADIDANLSELAVKRATLLASLDDDGVTAVQSLDKAADAERAARAILADKAKALAEECRKLTYASREKDRRAAIEKIKGKLKRREQIAADLQHAIERVGELYTQLTTRDEAEQHWGFPRPGGGFAVLDLYSVRREVAWLLHGLVNQFGLPSPSSAGLGVTGISARTIPGVVSQQNESIISRLSVVPIGEDLMKRQSIAEDLTIMPAAAADLSVPGAGPVVPAPPPMSYAAAESRKQEMLNDPETRNKIMAGDVTANAEWKRVIEGLSRQPELPASPRDEAAAHLQQTSGFTLAPEHLQEIIENRPVTPDEARMARGRFEARIQDPDWRAKYSRGDLEAKKEMALIQSVLSRPIKDPQTT